jgi:DNA-directed RNA polymerase II subunit RPB1
MALEHIRFVQFGKLTSEEWASYSVCEVKKPSPQGGSDKNREGTPYDHRMGCLENGYLCTTCGGDNKTCPGHFGHIVLPIPIYDYNSLDCILKILQCVCPKCAKSRLLPVHAGMHNLTRLEGTKRLRAFAKKCEKIAECPWLDCQEPLPSYEINVDYRRQKEIRRYFEKSESVTFKAGEAYNIFIRIDDETTTLLGFNSDLSPNSIFSDPENLADGRFHIHQFRPESLIFNVFPVPPPFTRPFVVRDGQRCDDDLTDKINSILKACIKINEDNNAALAPSAAKGRKRGGKLTEVERQKAELELQNHIWTFMDNSDEKSKLSSGGRAHKSIAQRINGKEGRIQGNITGKRVDFSARSVIVGGGIMLKMDELGVPRKIAQELTRKFTVQKWNIAKHQKTVSEGKVNRVIRLGTIKRLNTLPDKGVHFTLMEGDIIERQLQDGDYILFNRQPSLRADGSMVVFRLKVIDGRPFRLPLCFTRGYNADFDGDEMNGHMPQSIAATAESAVLMRAAVHIIAGQRNAPVNSIVQDGLNAWYIATNHWDDGDITLVPRDLFMNIVTGAEISMTRYNDMLMRASKYYPRHIKVKGGVPRIVTKKIPGTLMASILFPPNFCYSRVTDTNPKYPEIQITDGVMLPESGPFCSKSIGAKASSIVHVLWIEYSPETCLRFLSDCQQVSDRWLCTHGFSMGISDCMATSKDEVARVLSEMHAEIAEILKRCDGTPDKTNEAEINRILNSKMNVGLSLAKSSMAKGDRNALNIMRICGAKGGIVNLVQIAAFVGQQNINAERIPSSRSGGTRTLPHFRRGDYSAEAKGFVEHSYVDGLTPQEMFFHSAGGRKGIIATAIKTAETGYIQKRIDKKMEDHHVETDGTVRDANGQIIQFLYGSEGMDPKKLCYARSIDFPFFVNPVNIARRLNSDARRSEKVTSDDEPRNLAEKEIELLLSYINAGPPQLKTAVTVMATKNARSVLKKLLESPEVTLYECMIPCFCAELKNIYEKAKIQHGEMVGHQASSAIGEPTTQMNLNTFHYAGFVGKDVSIGVPRFNEILNTTKSEKQKKTSCTVYFNHSELSERSESIRKLKLSNSKLPEGSSKIKTNEKLIEMEKETCLSILQEKKRDFEETTIATFYVDYEMQYLPQDINPDTGMSPIGVLTYQEYDRKWWVQLHEDMNSPPEITPESWVLIMKFNTEEMFRRGVDLEDIANAIDEKSEGKYCCVPSPNIIGTIEVYCNFSDIRSYALSKKKLSDENMESHITDENMDFFLCRDVALEYIKKIPVSGISGVTKVYSREETKTNEWVMDVECRKISAKDANKRFLDILTLPGVDSTRTVTDDMHAICAVLGIEATRKFLIQEITRLISFDGTYVNQCFITLLVDSMVYTGSITSVARDGIPRTVGPIAKVCFEESMDNASQASLFAENDMMNSVSSSIMFGLTAKAGTGLVSVKPVDKVSSKPVSRTEEVTKSEKSHSTTATKKAPVKGSRRKNVIGK